jgi:hypothetical protein
MLRITLDEDFGGPIRMVFGYEIVVPMQFGAADPALMTNFRGDRQPLPAKARVWELDWVREDLRSTLIPEEAATHYFGDSRADSPDNELVRQRKIPNFNDERIRVAQVWGDYFFSDQHGKYATVRIDLPRIPKVSLAAVNHNGVVVDGSPVFQPWEFFRWADLLDAGAEEEMAALRARRPSLGAQPRPPAIDIANLSPDQLDALANALAKRVQPKARAS